MISKRVGGKTYYYLATSARVDGKPRIVNQKYLGTAADIEAAMDGAVSMPSRTRHLAFGDLAATWAVIEKLEVVGIIDRVSGGRRADAGASVGAYLALAAMNRVVAPCSKLAFADWWAGTAGDRLIPVAAAALDHRRFWDAMHAVHIDALAEDGAADRRPGHHGVRAGHFVDGVGHDQLRHLHQAPPTAGRRSRSAARPSRSDQTCDWWDSGWC